MHDFRKGNYDYQSPDVQCAWLTFCEHVLSKVNTHWKSKQQMTNTFVSEVVTASDEAFGLLIAKKKVEGWLTGDPTTWVDDEEGQSVAQVAKPAVRPKSPVPPFTDTEIHEYYDLVEDITKLRSYPETGENWEKAFMMFVGKAVTSSASAASTADPFNSGEEDDDKMPATHRPVSMEDW